MTLDLAAKHNDLEQFQIVFNEWVRVFYSSPNFR